MFEGLKKKFSDAIKGFVKSEEKKAQEIPNDLPISKEQQAPQDEQLSQPTKEAQYKQTSIRDDNAIMHNKPHYKEEIAENKTFNAKLEQKNTSKAQDINLGKNGELDKNDKQDLDSVEHLVDNSKGADKTQHKDLDAKMAHVPDAHGAQMQEKTILQQKVAANHNKTPEDDASNKSNDIQKPNGEPLIKLGIATRIKKAIFGTVTLSEGEVSSLTEKLKISMLESDVSFDVADEFSSDLHNRLVGKRIESKDISKEVLANIHSSLMETLSKAKPDFDIFERIKAKDTGDPFVVLFLGPNGTGKTTTIAKMANRLKSMGVSVALSASDTFRAAAIEQLEHHGKVIGVPVIKGAYGADPASIAFDAIAFSKAHKIAAVLVDSAGRQETNKNLIREVEKMFRVAKPDITIYVGESTSGNAITSQILEFSKHVKINGVILTKLDCDAKGGSALSISHATGIPILFFGTGESYDAMVAYDPSFIADAIMPSAA